MKKKQIKKKPIQKKEHRQTQAKVTLNINALRKLKTFLTVIIGVFAFTLYAQSIKHGYTLDDHKVVDQNNITTKGIAGIPTILTTDYWYGSGNDELRGPIYRPASLIIYAILWEFSANNPHLNHFINVLLYSFTCMILFLLLCKLFNKQNLLLPFVCSLLYVAHPIHTEVVNNIKSLDEILCFLFSIISIFFLLKYISTRSKTSFILGGVGFFLSLLSKETGISFLLIIPLVIFFFADYSKRSIAQISILLVTITILWSILRIIVFKDLHQNIVTATSPLNNTLYAAPDFASKYATAFYILLRYVGLLIFPHPLTSDYNYAQIKIQTFNEPVALLGIFIYAAMAAYSIFNFKKKNIIVFGILFYLLSLAPVSNIFFLGGSSMAERFMYIPSFGFCLILAYFLIRLTKTENVKLVSPQVTKLFFESKILFLFAGAIAILYSIKTYSRSRDWKDTLTIYSRDIHVSENSATANQLLGNSLILQVAASTINKNRLDTFNLAKIYLKRALEIAPSFYYASSNLGYVYLIENKPDSAYLYLKEGVKNGPNDIQINYYLGSALLGLQKFDEAIKVLTHAVSLNPNNKDAYFTLASSYLGNGDANNALLSYSKIIELDPSNGTAYYYSGLIFKSKGDIAKANEFINKALSLGYKPN
jgi:tetratricopeptide (TPR) repeat protein